MHRIIFNTPLGMETDHINGNSLDNRKINLRICTHYQNSLNTKHRKNTTSIYRGVSWCSEREKWAVYISYNKKHRLIGRYNDEIEAEKAYNEAALIHHGEFSNINLIR